MKVILINPNPFGAGLNEATVEPPLGLAYIAAVLEKNNYTCGIIDANVLKLSEGEIIDRISGNTDVIGIYMNSFSYNAVCSLIQGIRLRIKSSLIILGGPIPSAVDPVTVLQDTKCDALIRGEGEYSLLEIVNNLSAHKPPFEGEISGLNYFDTSGKLVSNLVKRILDLDSLPFPAVHLLPPFKTYKTRSRKVPVAAIITSRGCTFECTFCSKDIFERKVTFRSAKNVLDEIDFLIKKYGIRQIDILDDNVTQKRAQFVEILDGIIERKYGIAINLQSGIRAENIDEEIMRKMKQAGVYKLAFGIESVDEHVLNLHKKRLDLSKIEAAVRLSKKMGFLTYGFFIIGLPGESEKGFRKTLEFAKKLDFDVANFCMAIPFVNTELYRMVKSKGRFLIDTTKNIDAGFYGGKVFFEYEGLNELDVLRRYQKVYKEFYSPFKQFKILLTIRSLSELIWFKDAFLFIVKGLLKKNKRKRKYNC